jgi:hypothetical protein
MDANVSHIQNSIGWNILSPTQLPTGHMNFISVWVVVIVIADAIEEHGQCFIVGLNVYVIFDLIFLMMFYI